MTLRALLVGLLGVCVVCGYTYFNDGVLRQTMFVCNHMPTSVYGGLVLFLLLVNPLLRWLWRITGKAVGLLRPFSIRELALVLALVLPACCIPYSSMLRILPRVAMLPHHYVKTEVHWRWRNADGTDHNVLEYAPPKMLADISIDENQRLTGYTQGLRNGREPIEFEQVPWQAWLRTLLFWLPLFGILWLTLTGLSLAVHPQWSRHEHLPYPIVQFTKALLPAKDGETSPVFRDMFFWVAFITVMVVHINNFFYVYYPEFLVEIQRTFNFRPAARLFPTFMKGGGWSLITPRFYFAAVGLAYLLATDVSLSVGLSPFIFCYVGGLLAKRGISMGGGTHFTPRIDKSLVFGGYFGMFLVTLYTGRHYFLTLWRRVFGSRAGDKLDGYAVWGGRLFLAGFAVFVLDLCLLGLDWQLALLYAFLTILIFFIMGRTTGLVLFALLVGVAVATSVTLYFNYDRGVNWNDGFATKSVPRFAGDGAIKARQRLLAQDMLEESQKISGWARFARVKPEKRTTIAFFIAVAGVVLCSAGRLRFAKWPLHPVLFLVWSGYAGYMMAWSFLAGCLLKFAVSRFGGAQAYQRVKPLMFGLIAGDMVAGLAVIVMGFIYNQVTGELPKTYWVLPG